MSYEPNTSTVARSAAKPPAPATGSDPAASSLSADAGLVFQREFFSRLRSPMFLGGLAFSLALIIGGVVLSKVVEGESDVVGVVGTQPADVVDSLPQRAEDAGFSTITVERFDSRADLEEALLDGSANIGVIDGNEIVVKTTETALVGFVSLVWKEARVQQLLTGDGLDVAQQQQVGNAIGPLPVTELEPDPESGARQLVGTILVVLLFMTVQFTGGMMVSSVTEEKGNNIVELLLSSMSSKALLIGKLVANGLLGLIQVIILVGAGIVAVNVAGLGDMPAIPSSLLLVALVWYIIGFAFFGTLIAAGASLAPSQEDAQSVLMPVFVLVLFGYLASVYIASSPDSAIGRLISLLPFVSPFVMPARFFSGDLPLWEHGVALAVAAASLVVVLNVGSRIYTRSVIHTDRKLGWREAFSAEAVR